MHTQNEQKKCQISHNELIDNALSTFALSEHKAYYILLHIITYILHIFFIATRWHERG
jgi:hypothetical protein